VSAPLFDPYRLDKALLTGHAARLRRAAGPGAPARFAERLAAYAGRRYCLLTSSGRAAIRAGLAALGAGKGTCIGMTDVTHPSALDAALAAGARPELLDINPGSLNMSPARLKAAADKLDALIFTPMFSTSIPPELVASLAAANGFPVLEDASQAIGVYSGGLPYGSFGDISVFSLSSGKPVSFPGSKAGALLCDDPVLFRRAARAAAGTGGPAPEAVPLMELKLSLIADTLAVFRRNNDIYRHVLGGLTGLRLPATGREAQDFPVLAKDKAALEKFLLKLKLPLGRTYEPFHTLAPARGRFTGGALYAAQALHLPSYPMMTEGECLYAAGAVKGFYRP